MPDLVKRLSAAADRRRGMDPAALARLDAALMVLQQDHQGTGSDLNIGTGIDTDTLASVGEVFGLDSVDLDLLLVAAAPDVDANVGLAYGLLRGALGPARPAVGLALELVGISTMSPSAVARLGESGALRRAGLLEIAGDASWLARELWCPDRVVAHLQGWDVPGPELAAALLDSIPLPLAGSEQLARSLDAGVGFVWIHAPLSTAGLCLAAGALDAIGVRALAVRVTAPDSDGGAFLRTAIREAALLGRVLVLDGAERLGPPGHRCWAELANPVVPVIAVSPRPWDSDGAHLLTPMLIDAPVLEPGDREVLWQAVTGVAVPEGALSGLRLTTETLARAARDAQLVESTMGVPLTASLVRDAVRRVTGSASPSTGSRVGFDDLVLPEPVASAVHRLVGWARHREQLLASGLLQEAGGAGRGITALFSGSPGTGKTLAAHVVAAELGLDIVRVDLSAIVDKYIGETQKNLERVFHQAESLNVVLFFDEADALFGRRSEVKDAHDRYANQEVAYLLQRMEQFDGITILATNLRGNLDPAFSRRLSFIVHFPDPDVPTRQRLWQAHLARLGEQDPGDPIDADHLAAAVELTGGDIRNIVVAAGYDAAIEGTLPGMRHVVAATVAEYSKLGRRVPAGGFGQAGSVGPAGRQGQGG